MEIVETAILAPGVCAVTNTAKGPFLDTGRENNYGERCYLSVEWLREAGIFVGLGDPNRIDDLRAKIQEQAGIIEELEDTEDQLIDLRKSVLKTLRAGAVEIKDGQERLMKLRPVPGSKAVDLD